MIYSVNITQQALEEFEQAFEWLAQRTPQHAPLWYNRVLDAINSLEQFPTRCPTAPENEEADEEVRHLVVGDRIHAYRIIFAIRDNTVVILDIIHAARDNDS
jgi:plasmid stabilization system protein ParE